MNAVRVSTSSAAAALALAISTAIVATPDAAWAKDMGAVQAPAGTSRSADTQSPCAVLDGKSLTLAQVAAVARDDCPVALSDEALTRVQRSHALLLAYARMGKPVYGLNRGVGLNKDQTIFQGDAVSADARALSERFNHNMMLSHTVAYGDPAPRAVVRAAMLIRLNTALFGGTGIQPSVVRQYAEFLNHGLTPVVLGQGSVGEADITILPQIGLAMMGEGEIFYHGKKMAAADALHAAGVAPVKPFAKDSLAILSSNAYGAARAVLASTDAAALIEQADAVAALSLEGLDGNVAPLLDDNQSQRPYAGQRQSARHILSLLQGSALWERDDKRALQDPLSFRTMSQVNGAARESLTALDKQLAIQINSSDDNPTVALDVAPGANASSQERQYYVTEGDIKGAVLPSAGFDPTVWVVPLEGVGIALSQMAQASAQRILRLGDPAFTHLSRFLGAGDGALAYTTIQKPVSALTTEVRALSMPVSSDTLVLAGNIEDIGTNAPLVAERIDQQVRLLRTLLGIEMMHGAQAVDLRLLADPQRKLGTGTAALFHAFREHVAFLSVDRRLAPDIAQADRFLQDHRAIRN